jgi:hypothetical protein
MKDFTDQQALDWIAQELRPIAGRREAMQARLDFERKMAADPEWSKIDGKFPVAKGARRALVNIMEGLLA